MALSFADFPHERQLDPSYHDRASVGVDMTDDFPAVLVVKCEGRALESDLEILTPAGGLSMRALATTHEVHVALRDSDIEWLISELTALRVDFAETA